MVSKDCNGGAANADECILSGTHRRGLQQFSELITEFIQYNFFLCGHIDIAICSFVCRLGIPLALLAIVVPSVIGAWYYDGRSYTACSTCLSGLQYLWKALETLLARLQSHKVKVCRTGSAPDANMAAAARHSCCFLLPLRLRSSSSSFCMANAHLR